MNKKRLKRDEQSKPTFDQPFFSRPRGYNSRLSALSFVNIGSAETLVMVRCALHGMVRSGEINDNQRNRIIKR
jgi:hypothetical protein